MAALYLFALLVLTYPSAVYGYVVDDSAGFGRKFDGIGGLSGGGVSCLCFRPCNWHLAMPALGPAKSCTL